MVEDLSGKYFRGNVGGRFLEYLTNDTLAVSFDVRNRFFFRFEEAVVDGLRHA